MRVIGSQPHAPFPDRRQLHPLPTSKAIQPGGGGAVSHRPATPPLFGGPRNDLYVPRPETPERLIDIAREGGPDAINSLLTTMDGLFTGMDSVGVQALLKLGPELVNAKGSERHALLPMRRLFQAGLITALAPDAKLEPMQREELLYRTLVQPARNRKSIFQTSSTPHIKKNVFVVDNNKTTERLLALVTGADKATRELSPAAIDARYGTKAHQPESPAEKLLAKVLGAQAHELTDMKLMDFTQPHVQSVLRMLGNEWVNNGLATPQLRFLQYGLLSASKLLPTEDGNRLLFHSLIGPYRAEHSGPGRNTADTILRKVFLGEAGDDFHVRFKHLARDTRGVDFKRLERIEQKAPAAQADELRPMLEEFVRKAANATDAEKMNHVKRELQAWCKLLDQMPENRDHERQMLQAALVSAKNQSRTISGMADLPKSLYTAPSIQGLAAIAEFASDNGVYALADTEARYLVPMLLRLAPRYVAGNGKAKLSEPMQRLFTEKLKDLAQTDKEALGRVTQALVLATRISGQSNGLVGLLPKAFRMATGQESGQKDGQKIASLLEGQGAIKSDIDTAIERAQKLPKDECAQALDRLIRDEHTKVSPPEPESTQRNAESGSSGMPPLEPREPPSVYSTPINPRSPPDSPQGPASLQRTHDKPPPLTLGASAFSYPARSPQRAADPQAAKPSAPTVQPPSPGEHARMAELAPLEREKLDQAVPNASKSGVLGLVTAVLRAINPRMDEPTATKKANKFLAGRQTSGEEPDSDLMQEFLQRQADKIGRPILLHVSQLSSLFPSTVSPIGGFPSPDSPGSSFHSASSRLPDYESDDDLVWANTHPKSHFFDLKEVPQEPTSPDRSEPATAYIQARPDELTEQAIGPNPNRLDLPASMFNLRDYGGRGDCLFHALEETLDGKAVREVRKEVAGIRLTDEWPWPEHTGANALQMIQGLLQSLPEADAYSRMNGRQEITNKEYAEFQAEPGMYAGADELAQWCVLRGRGVVVADQHSGDLVRFDKDGHWERIACDAKDLKKKLAEILGGPDLVLHKSAGHWQRIESLR